MSYIRNHFTEELSMDINKNIGHQIRYYRKKLNLTQQELADQIGISWEMISRYERGSSSPIYKIDEISQALKIKPYELLVSNNHEDNYNNSSTKLDNQIPLFTKIPINNEFSFEKTSFSYTAPNWIVKKYDKVFAIDPDIISIATIQLKNAGVLYINKQTKKFQPDELVLYRKDNELLIDSHNSIKDGVVIGKVLAQEIRL